VGNVAKSGKMCTLLAYITSRAVMDRLDAVVGPENWKDEYHKTPLGNGFECRLSIRMTDGTWVTKIDGAEPTQIESIKGAYSDSFKRAAVKWGIGRYLYRLPLVWVPIQSKGQIYVSSKGTTGYATPPELPQWALPVTYQSKPPSVAPAAELPNPEPPKDETPHDELWTKDQKWFCAAMGSLAVMLRFVIGLWRRVGRSRRHGEQNDDEILFSSSKRANFMWGNDDWSHVALMA